MKVQASFLPEHDLIHYAQVFGPMAELEIEGQRVYVTHPFEDAEQLKALCGTFQGRLEQAGKTFAGAVIQPAGEEPPVDPEKYGVKGPLKVRLDYGQSRPWSVQDSDPPNQRRYEVAASEPLKHPDTVVVPPNEFYANGLREIDVVSYYEAVRPIILDQYRGNKWDGLVMAKVDDHLIVRRHDSNAEKAKQTASLITIEYLDWRVKNKDLEMQAMTIETEEAFDHLNRGRTLEFHCAVGEQTNTVWVDLDPNEAFPFDEVKVVALDMLEELKKIANIERFDIRFSGKTGFHVLGFLAQPMDTNEARDQVKMLVRAYIDRKGDDRLVDKATKDPKQMRLDYTTLHAGGGLRLAYSLAYPTGLVCLTIPPAQVREFSKEDARMDVVLSAARMGSVVETDGFGVLAATDQKLLEIGHMYDWWLNHNHALPEDLTLIDFTFELIKKGDPKDNWRKLAFFLRGFLKMPDLDASKVASMLDDMKIAQETKKLSDPHSMAPASPTRSLTAVGATKFDAELEEYERKREFGETPEPKGTVGADTPATFVVQQHQAHKAGLHYDFRLAANGVLKSWAIPKLPALLSGQSQQVLAVEVEDHPLDYAAFEGTIPSGYGAGDVKIWDDGAYQTVSQDDNHWKFKLQGQHLKGAFTLFRIAGKNWNLRRAKDAT